jgi:hypothetical protein
MENCLICCPSAWTILVVHSQQKTYHPSWCCQNITTVSMQHLAMLSTRCTHCSITRIITSRRTDSWQMATTNRTSSFTTAWRDQWLGRRKGTDKASCRIPGRFLEPGTSESASNKPQRRQHHIFSSFNAQVISSLKYASTSQTKKSKRSDLLF